MKYVAMTLVAVLAMSGVSMGDITYDVGEGITATVSDGVDLGYDLMAYTVNFKGTQGFEGLWVDGAVHQVWNWDWDDDTGYVQTPFDGDCEKPYKADEDIRPFDTCWAFSEYSGELPDTPMETSSTGNEHNLPPILTHARSDVNEDQEAWGGLGTIDGRGTNSAFKFGWSGEIPTEGFDILYAVIPTGQQVFLNGLVANADRTVIVEASVPIGVPEPGTVLMLLAGALCLLGIRRR
jgi:hypothetical protein